MTARAAARRGDIRHGGRLGVRPTKKLGQNFVIEQGTVRKIAALAAPRPGDVILEVGPGLGSLTLALLDAVAGAAGPAFTDGICGTAVRDGAPAPRLGPEMIPVRLVAVEIDPVLAARAAEARSRSARLISRAG